MPWTPEVDVTIFSCANFDWHTGTPPIEYHVNPAFQTSSMYIYCKGFVLQLAMHAEIVRPVIVRPVATKFTEEPPAAIATRKEAMYEQIEP